MDVINFLELPQIHQFMMDVYVSILTTKNISKNFYSYGLRRTMYPDQGNTVNVFPIFPKLITPSAA